ncbi:hypothetical protein HX834_04790 [Marine Group I thaumarchaeote]|uniref:Uncharacterized protein n=1 Tax=Marine Group I thaumarchaeote TaxID=2511932 RepID=A0A7K4N1C0_9ARCH|nr:hypothetical protein [Marine Group I thaumarchaeote]
MASTKGIAVTIAILVGVVAASFLVYLIPEDTTMKIVVSDFKKHLDITKEKASMEITSIDESFEKLMEKKISPDEYINIAEVSSSQINSLIIELTSSGAAQEWYDSYANYIGALKKLNEKITETIVVANLMNSDNNSNSINEIITKIHQLETESLDLIKKSDNTRP